MAGVRQTVAIVHCCLFRLLHKSVTSRFYLCLSVFICGLFFLDDDFLEKSILYLQAALKLN